jgi:hypothetical protein
LPRRTTNCAPLQVGQRSPSIVMAWRLLITIGYLAARGGGAACDVSAPSPQVCGGNPNNLEVLPTRPWVRIRSWGTHSVLEASRPRQLNQSAGDVACAVSRSGRWASSRLRPSGVSCPARKRTHLHGLSEQRIRRLQIGCDEPLALAVYRRADHATSRTRERQLSARREWRWSNWVASALQRKPRSGRPS